MYPTKEEADSLYNAWCSSEDNILEYDGVRVESIEYDEDDDVCLVFENGNESKVISLIKNYIELTTFEWVGTKYSKWKQ